MPYDKDSRDDGYPLSKIVYNCSREALYIVRVGRSCCYYDHGAYVLECLPAPKSFRVYTASPDRLDAVLENNYAAFANRSTAYAPVFAGNADRISARQVQRQAGAARPEPGFGTRRGWSREASFRRRVGSSLFAHRR